MNAFSDSSLESRELRNYYFCMRHGRSKANEKGLIISDRIEGSQGWGLTSDADEAVRNHIRRSSLDGDTLIFCSPFTRAVETARLAAGILKSAPPTLSAYLRERWFGEWDATSHENYAVVWEADRLDPGNQNHGVESPQMVLSRVLTLLNLIEEEFSGRRVLLVSHGDPLDILLTWARRDSLTHHMDEGLSTAEIRPLFGAGASSEECGKL